MVSVNFKKLKSDGRYNWQHLVLVSKCRYRVFRQQKTIDCVKKAFSEVEERFGFRIKEMGFGEDFAHIHMIVDVPSIFSMSETLQIFKSHSASKIFQEIPNFLKRYPKKEFWSGKTSAKARWVWRVAENAAPQVPAIIIDKVPGHPQIQRISCADP